MLTESDSISFKNFISNTGILWIIHSDFDMLLFCGKEGRKQWEIVA